MPKAERKAREPKEPKAAKEGKAKKDPNAPKKNTSAYMHFSQAKRAEVKAENPDATFGEIGKLLGEAWKNVTDAEKKKYEAAAKADKERYEKELAAYKSKQAAEADEEDEE